MNGQAPDAPSADRGSPPGVTAERLLHELERIRSEVADLTDRRAQERFDEERVLRALVEGTAGATGELFFRTLVRQLAEALRVRSAFVAEFTDARTRVRTLAYWSGHDWQDNVEYELAGTPCQDVVDRGLCHYPERVAELFPADVPLKAQGIQSYLGVPLLDERGETLGHLAVMDTAPMPEEPRGLSIFRIFANRARAELERKRADRELERAQAELEKKVHTRTVELERSEREMRTLLEINRAVTRHLRRDQLLESLTMALRPLVPIDRMGVFLTEATGDQISLWAFHSEDAEAKLEVGDSFRRAGSAAGWVLAHRAPLLVPSRDDVRDRFPETCRAMESEGMHSGCILPLLADTRPLGALFLFARAERAYDEQGLAFLMEMAGALAVAFDNCLAYEEIARLRDRLAADNVYLQEEIRAEHGFSEILGSSPSLLRALRQVEVVAPTDTTVLLWGETGTGKEQLARAIHERSRRSDRPLIKVNSAAIAAGLVESELFGHVKGAFTGAVESRAGRFQLADGGTLFLDEVGELPLETQAKLLRVLQEGELEPVGSSRTQKVDVRIIAATNRDLEAEVRAGRFRADLYYRLDVFPIRLPPLRERRSDIPVLVNYFVDRQARRAGKTIRGVSASSMRLLQSYDWPGNVREMQNVIERAVVLCDGEVLEVREPLVLVERPAPAPLEAATGGELATVETPSKASPAAIEGEPPGAAFPTLEQLQRRHILAALERAGGVIDGAKGAARMLGLHANTLRSRLEKLGIRGGGGTTAR